MPLTTLQREAQRLVAAGILQDRTLGRAGLLRANLSNRAAAPLTQLLAVTFGPETVIGEEFDLPNAEQVLIYGSWAKRYHGTPGPPPNDVDVLVVGSLDRADVYDAADRAQAPLGLQVNSVIRTSDQDPDSGYALAYDAARYSSTAILAQLNDQLQASFRDAYRDFLAPGGQ